MDHEDVDLAFVEREKALIESLSHGRAYGHPVENVRVLDTHISWVVLTGSFAYKIKKPIKLVFLDYSTLQKRKQYCELELELNRRWASNLYLDVVPICGSFSEPFVGGKGTPIEYAVKMRQFPQSAQLDEQLDEGLLDEADMFGLAETVAKIHAVVPVYRTLSAGDFFAAIGRAMLDNFDFLQDGTNEVEIDRLLSWTRQGLDDFRELMIKRYESGFVRECHGDLHLRNLVRLSSGIVPYDCVEFSVELRNIDVISDVSFLVMDLVARGETQLAHAFINRYLECSGDYAGVSLLGLYVVYHALIRAKIAAIRGIERVHDTERNQDREETAHYCAVARRWIDAGRPRLIIMQRLHGLGETEGSSSAVAEGLYAPNARTGIYERLADVAETILEAGHNVIVDASFLDRAERNRFRDLAGKVGSDFSIVSVSAAREELHRRLERRQRDSTDPSEADVAVLGYQLEHEDALDADERDYVIDVATDEPVDIDRLVSGKLSLE
jgi:aminoglycoside phosphotransferase family enzyme/predicted kinase